MENRLFQPNRKPGSYLRKELKNDVLYGFFRHKQIRILFAQKTGAPTRVVDTLARDMEAAGILDAGMVQSCETAIQTLFATPELVAQYDHTSLEEIYELVQRTRIHTLGAQNLVRYQLLQASTPCTFAPENIDQQGKKSQLLADCRHVIFALWEARFFSLMEQDIQQALSAGKQVWVLTSKEAGLDLPDEATMRTLLKAYPVHYMQDTAVPENTCALAYGEDGLLYCRDLTIPAMVHAIPQGYYAQAMTNQLGKRLSCLVYIPAGFDITPWVRLKERTRLSYWQLYQLQKAYGDDIYRLTPHQLYHRYPQYFINIYESQKDFIPSPLSIAQPEDMADFDQKREAAIAGYIDSFENFQYSAAYFDKDLNRQSISTDAKTKQDGILVHSVRVKKAQNARVIRCEKGQTLRQVFTPQQTGIVSNFLFFMTPKLATLYNDLRKDRPREQADVAAGHLDYMLLKDGDRRKETFPLFRKTCIAKTRDGQFLFFNFRLGGGSVQINGHPLRWEKDHVDKPEGCAPVQVFTPYYSLADEDADRESYRKPVGAGRVNLVVLQDRICCARAGDVILPSAGVVISLDAATAAPILNDLPVWEDGYYDVTGLSLQVTLDPPDQIPDAQWAQVVWAYGGGLSLIVDGVGLCDADHMDSWFAADGWKSPLSRQTQESTLHTLVKHPRTAIGILPCGDLIVLVFSGRTWRSTGANYDEMCRIARSLYGNVQYLMNMDGGGSAMLGMVTQGQFMELSCPSTSMDSCVGMVRPINTVLYFEGECKK